MNEKRGAKDDRGMPTTRRPRSEMRSAIPPEFLLLSTAFVWGGYHPCMRMLLTVFDWYSLLRGGQRFRNSGLSKQRSRIREWATAPLGPCRDMVEFHRKMGAFVALSIEYGDHP